MGRVLERPDIARLAREHGRSAALEAVRSAAAELRHEPADGRDPGALEEELARRAGALVRGAPRRLRRVINGTGVVIHTNLGRAPISPRAAAHAAEVASSYSNLELDLGSGRRGDRQALLSELLRRLAGVEAALVVNNGAAAVLLGLTALCRGREVVVSRGEAIEIGGGFRIPDILRLSGARLVEVGTTNRTRVGDYLGVLGDRTAAFLRVHQSNFRMEGFVQRPGLEELAAAAHRSGLLMLEDVGSGLIPAPPASVGAEDRLRASSSAGADLVFCSGDKLIGGSQAGLILGRRELVERMRRHPLHRALRPDKLQLAALEETLLAYERPGGLAEVPVWEMLGLGPEQLRQRAERWAAHLRRKGVKVSVVEMAGAVGGGTTPGPALPSFGVLLAAPSPARTRRALLRGEPPILALERSQGVAIDARCVLPGEEHDLLAAVGAALGAQR